MTDPTRPTGHDAPGLATPVLDAHVVVRNEPFELDARFTLAAGETVVMLGPNGAGKTTLLRALAGLIAVDEGHIVIDGRLVDGRVVDDRVTRMNVPPEDRPLSLVFQDYLLFPHLSALDNVAFGPRARGLPRATARARAADLLEQFDLTEHAARKPRQLSGGQRQRVALARALAAEPRLLLLDEPLAALDVTTRTTVRRDLRRHLDGFTGATVVVTHDPLDALAIAQRVIILDAGDITQDASLAEITTRPRSRYAADLVGLNLLDGQADDFIVTVATTGGGHEHIVIADRAQGAVHILIHPRAVTLHINEPSGSPRNHWSGRVTGFDLLGDRVRVRVDGSVPLVAEVTPAAVTALGLTEGRPVWTAVKATEITTYPA